MKFQYIILLSLLLIGCTIQKNKSLQNFEMVRTELYKIDLKDSIIIYHKKTKALMGFLLNQDIATKK